MKIYFLGICGTAMGNAALLVREAGHQVCGSDANVYPPMSDVLRAAEIEVFEGFDADRLEKLNPDLVVVGNALSRGNAEIEWLLNSRGLPMLSLPAMLHEFILKKRGNIVVCGTHGKTTTTALAAFLLKENGIDAGWLIGGAPIDPPTGNRVGGLSAPFVIEGDEYDSAFFDKRSKFIHYAPQVAVINNIEFDHADIFRDLTDVLRTFSHLTRIVPGRGWIVVNGDDDNIAKLGSLSWTRVVRVGTGVNNDVRITDFFEKEDGVRFSLFFRGKLWADVVWNLPGIYNARNAAMAAVAAQLAVLPGEVSLEEALNVDGSLSRLRLDVLGKFRGVRRRQEVLAESDRLTVVEDFGHHPTAVAETLKSFRNRFPGARLTAVFEPRSNTARTRALQPAFCEALALADEIYIGAVNRADKLPPSERFDADAVIADLRAKGRAAFTAETNAALLEKLCGGSLSDCAEKKSPRQLVVFFSNGSFDGIIAEFARRVRGCAGT